MTTTTTKPPLPTVIPTMRRLPKVCDRIAEAGGVSPADLALLHVIAADYAERHSIPHLAPRLASLVEQIGNDHPNSLSRSLIARYWWEEVIEERRRAR